MGINNASVNNAKTMFNCKCQSIFYGFSNCSMLAGVMDYFGAVILALLTVFLLNDIF